MLCGCYLRKKSKKIDRIKVAGSCESDTSVLLMYVTSVKCNSQFK